MSNVAQRPDAEAIVHYHKDPQAKIATITLNRPERLNAPTAAARLRSADLVHRANVDDEVKVLLIRGEGKHMGSVMTAWLESMLPLVKSDGEMDLDVDTFGKGLANSVKDNDSLYPADWRLSHGARPPLPPAQAQVIAELQAQVEALQKTVPVR